MSLKDIFTEREIVIGSKVQQKLQSFIDKYKELFDLKIDDIALNAYYMYPCMFKEDFPKISDEEKIDLAVFGMLYYTYVITFDMKIDNETQDDTWGLFCQSFFAQEAIKGLGEFLYPDQKKYFDIMDKYVKEYINAVKLEEKSVGNCDYDHYSVIMRGKSAIAKCFAAAMAVKSGRIDILDRLEKSQDYFYEGFQLFDDFKDVKHDIEIGKHNWITDNVDISKGEIYTQLYKQKMIETIFQKINHNCDKAIALAGKSVGWLKNIYLFKSKIQKVYNDIVYKDFIPDYSVIKDKSLKLNEIKGLEDTLVNYLIDNYKVNRFLQITHYMNFYNEEGYSGNENQSGDTFARTFLLNLLKESKNDDLSKEIPQMFSEWEEELLEKETKIFKCGWSYFPDLKELAPDIDTLSEVMRFASEVQNNELKQKVNRCIEFVIENCIKEDGSINTWILSKYNMSDAEKYARDFAETRWKIRQDPEVVANFLYSLKFYKNKTNNFKKIIEKGLKYLVKHRGKDGLWESSWYCGKMYGTYVCTRCLKEYAKEDIIIENVLTTVLGQFDEEGYYLKKEYINDYLFAILILTDLYYTKYVEKYLEKIISIFKTAQKYLSNQIDEEIGFLSAAPFIKVSEVVYKNGDKEYKYDLTYESLLITTALGLNCCEKIKGILEEQDNKKLTDDSLVCKIRNYTDGKQ